MPTVSIVVPAFNEEECVDELASRLSQMAAGLPKYDFEFVIVENGSVDSTFQKLFAIHQADPRFRVVQLSRNFGMEGAVTAGLHHITGDAAVIMCADLQDPPELVPEFVRLWEQGYENVFGEITARTDESWLRQRLTRVFYWMLNRANQHPVPQNVSDFRLVSKRMYATLNALPEKHRMLRAMWGWIGYKSVGVKYVRPPRAGGQSTYRLFRNIAFALHAIAASSTTPLRLIPLVGLVISAVSFLSIVVLAIRWISRGVPFRGFGSIVALQLALFGLLFMLLSVLSEYVGMIFEEVRDRPLFIVDRVYETPILAGVAPMLAPAPVAE